MVRTALPSWTALVMATGLLQTPPRALPPVPPRYRTEVREFSQLLLMSSTRARAFSVMGISFTSPSARTSNRARISPVVLVTRIFMPALARVISTLLMASLGVAMVVPPMPVPWSPK